MMRGEGVSDAEKRERGLLGLLDRERDIYIYI